MAPTVSDTAERGRPLFSLEDYLEKSLRLRDGVRTTPGAAPCSANGVNPVRDTSGSPLTRMGLVSEEAEAKEGKSPPSQTPLSPPAAHTALVDKRQDLIQMSLRTLALYRRNQELQRRLTALQRETQALARSSLRPSLP